ncbi:MAG: hypothetical protein WD929_08945 [Steroidobacteraceae bacterium]
MPTRRVEAVAAVGRDEAPADVQLTRAFIAVGAGLVLAMIMLRPAGDAPNVRTLLPELHAVAGIPCLVIKFFYGDF